MLDAHLIAQTSPQAHPRNVIVWKHYRLTLLGERLFRLEHNSQGIFRDGATQAVWFRDAAPVRHKVRQTPDALVVETAAAVLTLRPRRADCRIRLLSFGDGSDQKIENRDNLHGTYRTLDCCDGGHLVWRWDKGYVPPRKVDLGYGVCARSGVAVIDDAHSLTLGRDGEVRDERGLGTDEYIFAYGHDYAEAVRGLYQITGRVPMIPRFALGNWWSRYHAYSDVEYLKLLTEFSRRDIPLTVATVDMDWHWSDQKEMDERFGITRSGRGTAEYMSTPSGWGWTGYTWNTDLFPDYRDFLRRVRAKNLRVTLNIHPAQGVRYFDGQYEEMARACGVDPKSGLPVPFRIADPNFINRYFSLLHKPFERDGVDFWWIDWQQGTQSELAGLDPLWALNHYHYLDNAVGHGCPLILSRYFGIGSHRYPLGFSGDTLVTWKTLKYLPYFTSTASNVGYTWWSHDIGGHCLGSTRQELYVRHLQFGVFSPVNRLHCSNDPTFTKEPWCYGNGAGRIAADWLRFRHRLIPFLYTAAVRTHREGLALIEPLYYRWDVPAAYSHPEEYLFGSQLLVTPVTSPRERDGFARTPVWIPRGKWHDIFTGDVYEIGGEGEERVCYRELDEIPVLAPAGGFLPLSSDAGNGTSNPHALEVWTWSGDGTYTLCEDDAEHLHPEKQAETTFASALTVTGTHARQTVTVRARGRGVIPADRTVTLALRDVPEAEVTLTCDGEALPTENLFRECAAVALPCRPGHTMVVTFEWEIPDARTARLAHARAVMLRAEGTQHSKAALWGALCAAQTVEEYRAAVDGCDLCDGVKGRLTESL